MLQQIKTTPSRATDRLLTRREAAELLQVSQATLRRAARRGELGYVRIGQNRVLFERAELERYIAACRVSERGTASGAGGAR